MTDIIISFLNFLKGMVLKLPDLAVDSSVLSSIVSSVDVVMDFIAGVNFIVPVDTILLILSIVYGIRLAKFLLFAGNWVLRRIFDLIP